MVSDLALLSTALAVSGLFLLSPEMLEAHGIAYLTSGGGILSKVHPATLLALSALALRCLATRRPLRKAWRLATGDAGVVLLLIAFLITALFASVVSHTPVTPLIDTFLLPILMLLLLRDLDPALLRLLAVIVSIIFCVNAAIALIEVSSHWRLMSVPVPEGVTSDPRRGDATFDWRASLAEDWRATALFGHPLTNGLLTGAFIICGAAPASQWMPVAAKVPALLLQAVAMFAFGARSALVLTIAAVMLLALVRAIDGVRAGRRLSPRAVAAALVIVFVAVALGLVLLESSLVGRMLERFQNDEGSATTRITMFKLFAPFSWADIALGPDPLVVATQQRLEGLEFGIESSWIGLLLGYGGVVTAILLTGLAAFSRSIVKSSGPGGAIVLVYFFILVGGAATLSTKTTIFAMTTVLILVFLPRDADRQRAPALPRPGAM